MNGIRLYYVDRTWVLRSRLIAVRQFNPTKELLEDNRLSTLLQKYLERVLAEYGLDVSLLFSATSDAGSDVKRLCDVLLPGLWEWCVCHMMNCAVVKAFGMHVDPAKSRNPGARKVITTVKTIVEHIRKSPRAKAIFEEEQVRQYAQCYHRKLVNAAPQRWSGVTNVLEAVIVNRPAIDGVYAAEGKHSPLTSLTDEIDELHYIIKPAAQVIVSGERPATSTPREHSLLTGVARGTRQHMCESVDWRWFDKRYKSAKSQDTDYVFDMQMALHPTTADLRYVDKLASTSAFAGAVKSTITDKVISLAVKLAEAAALHTGDGSTTPAWSAAADKPAAKRARQAAAPGSKEEPPSFEQTARAELTKLRAVQGGSLAAGLRCEDVLKWWKMWAHAYPLLARVARVVIGALASAAVLEHDFSNAGRMMTSSRSTMDSKYVEMILFLHGNLDLIPEDITKLTEAVARTKIPGRLANPVEGLEQLDGAFAPVDLTDEEASD
ncbi:unnamed protein product [Ectocarpus sp. CCAP 1310/34]|nr:unnamed protein product [Ectocarpus sp. CCAP 1310/34]